MHPRPLLSTYKISLFCSSMHPATKLLPTITNKTSKGESKDEEEADNASSDTSSDIEEAGETLRRSSRPSRKKPDHIQWWNPQTKQYEGGGAKIDVVTAAKSKSRSDNKPPTDLHNNLRHI